IRAVTQTDGAAPCGGAKRISLLLVRARECVATSAQRSVARDHGSACGIPRVWPAAISERKRDHSRLGSYAALVTQPRYRTGRDGTVRDRRSGTRFLVR